ncbi:hypothetical protein FJ651_15305 [Paucihalobacter ruber]|uniref:Uncharacterized protein n=1 Tax=Paucihalobacter ruber TaxID=2567861 RepID=A0A506PC52_9FLAO|nr:hypothetical protein [Paucihalobacter ruber]TPV31551.1 hypothetical protein FJ651_15305 [Paucihalobacter ruber]
MIRILVFLLIGICFCSCDGRYKLKSSKPEAVKTFSAKTQNETVIKYIPNKIAEIEVDTLIYNKTNIKIYSKLNKHNVVNVPAESSNPSTVLAYQNAQTTVLVQQEDRELFNKSIDKTLFYNTDLFWNYAVLESVWVNEEQSLANSIVLDVVFKNPVLKIDRLCYLIVNENGSYTIKVV